MSGVNRAGGARRALLVAACGLLLAATPASANVPPLHGFNNHAFVETTTAADPSSNVGREIALERGAGANVQRVDVSWLGVEPRPGAYAPSATAALDNVVDSAASAGIRSVIVLEGTPCWASSAPHIADLCLVRDYDAYPPASPATYGRFVAWLTSRYGSKLAGVEVWNEPNTPGGENFRSLDPPASYAALVEAAHRYRTNRVPIVAGALNEWTRADDIRFMRQLFAQPGFRHSFDIWSLHAYDTTPSHVVVRVEERRNVLSSYGIGVPMWVDEFGWSTCSLCGITQTQQGTLLAATFQALTRPSLGVTAAMSYDLRDDGEVATDEGHNFGVVERAYTPKAAYAAVRRCLVADACG